MKILRLLSLLTVVALAAPSVYAAEQIQNPVAVAASVQNSDQAFHAVITGNDELILKAGEIFTTGNHTANQPGNTMELPYLISHPKAVKYPRWALKQGYQGEMTVAIEVTLEGKVGRYKVMQSTGHKSLDNAAIKAVQGWKFQPAVKDGQDVVTCIQIAIRFQIQ